MNQDSVLLLRAKTEADGEVVLAVICDGVGGMKKGESASAAVAVAFERWFGERLPELIGRPDAEAAIFGGWSALIKELHARIKTAAQAGGVQSGTTLEALLLCGGRYYICHVGDCRVYALNSALEQLTHDQTYVQREVDAGRMTPEQARRDKDQSLLLQCIGAGAGDIRPDFISGRLEEGQMFLLCCDGQRRRLSDAEMEKQLLKANRRPRQKRLAKALARLAGLCRKRKEKDDISAVLVAQRRRGILPGLRPFAGRPARTAGSGVCILQSELLIHTEELPFAGDPGNNQMPG